MLRGIAQAHGGQAVDEHRSAAGDGLPGVGAAATGMHASISKPQCGFAIDKNIARTAHRRTGDGMRASGTTMGIGRGVGFIP